MTQMTLIAPRRFGTPNRNEPGRFFSYTLGLASTMNQEQEQQPERGRSRMIGSVGEQRFRRQWHERSFA
jgi:hypothetical protein